MSLIARRLAPRAALTTRRALNPHTPILRRTYASEEKADVVRQGARRDPELYVRTPKTHISHTIYSSLHRPSSQS